MTQLLHRQTGQVVELISSNGITYKVRHTDEDGFVTEGHAPICQFDPIDPTPWLVPLLAALSAEEGNNHRASLR